jgi:hypothetical protein
MTNTRDAETQRDDDSFVEFWRTNKVALTLAGIGAAAVVAGIVKSAYSVLEVRAGGDEPPIRVKGGSIDLRLLTNHHQWKASTRANEWKISGGPHRSKDDFDLVVDFLKGDSKPAAGKQLDILYTGGAQLQVSSYMQQTSVALLAGDPTKVTVDQQSLIYDRNGTTDSIREIILDGQRLWPDGPRKFSELLILDY